MQHDRMITISVGTNRKSINWQPQTLLLSEFYAKLKLVTRSTETMGEYLALKKSEQDDKKDIGGFVAGSLNGPRRKAGAVKGRDVVTLDFDTIPPGGTDDIVRRIEALGCGYCIYSTRKHTPASPRLRILLPLNRTATADEYEPVARYMASRIGIEFADPTTFEATRLMYWPSCCRDSEFVYYCGDKPMLSVDGILTEMTRIYGDWRDVLKWPQVPGADNSYKKLALKQADPLTKPGMVGAFCRTYDIYGAMDAFLDGIYEPVDTGRDRYTYLGGSTTGGAIVYDNGLFLYSHHATDPCSGKLVNSFDLVRLHKFGDKDDDADPRTPTCKLPSYVAMCEFALADEGVSNLIAVERMQSVLNDFNGVSVPQEIQPAVQGQAVPPIIQGEGVPPIVQGQNPTAAVNSPTSAAAAPTNDNNIDWVKTLEKHPKTGAFKSTIDNIWIILENDPNLKGKFAMNEFAGRGEILGELPWSTFTKRRAWEDNDSQGLYWYFEKYYGITGNGKIDGALSLHSEKHKFNDVVNYLNSLKWDGVERLDTLLVDYLGAVNNNYTRNVTRKAFTAAVARAMEPGCKYDTMLILAGPQGLGKSTLLDKMSRGWFNDSIRTFEGKEASELIQGVWLVEISELDAFRVTDVSRIKQFLSLRVDRFRAAYGHHVKDLPRRCVFFGTTNPSVFLRDRTGNRRFWPVDTAIVPRKKSAHFDLTDDVINQLWAEAVVRWRLGEPLYLSGEDEKEAIVEQELHREVSSKEGIILDFLDRPIPKEWPKLDLDKRRMWLTVGYKETDEAQLVQHDRVCALEIWCEAFGGQPKDFRYAESAEINDILRSFPDWEKTPNSVRFGYCGKQRGFQRKSLKAKTQDI